MNLELGAQVLVGVVPVLVALVALLGRPDRLRSRLKHDAEVASLVPEGTAARTKVLELVEHDAVLILEARKLTRELSGVGLGIGGSVALGFLAIWLFQRGVWWTNVLGVVAASLWVVFFFGIFDSAQLQDRVKKKAEREAKRLNKKTERNERMASRSVA